jgi:hypothetical protein
VFGSSLLTEEHVIALSLAQVAEIQDELYRIHEAVRKDPLNSARVMRLIKKFDAHSRQTAGYNQDTEEDYSHMVGLSKLIAQAQQQCQQ